MSARILILFLLFPFAQLKNSGLPQEKCQQMCAKDLRSAAQVDGDFFCGPDCFSQQCADGCSLYLDAASSGCQKVCKSRSIKTANVTGSELASHDETINCLMGCSFALEEYSRKSKSQLLPVRPLSLLTRNYSSLTFKWDTPIRENFIYKVYKIVVAMDTGWHPHEDATFRSNGTIEVTNLQPYVTYKFRVMIWVSSLPEQNMRTRDTGEITTSPHGAPSTAPEITSLTTPSPQVIVLSWTPPPFTNGQLLGYKIEVTAVNQSTVNSSTQELSWDVGSFVLRQLLPSQQYVVSISARNSEGEGPSSSRTITTPSQDESVSQEVPYLILGTSNKIIVRRLQDDARPVPQSPITPGRDATVDDQAKYIIKGGAVKGIDLHFGRQVILVTDGTGQVTWISLKQQSTRSNYYPSIRAVGPITVDWLNDRAYIASKDKVHSCSLDNDLCVDFVKDLSETPNDVKVDPINGYLYYVITGTDHGLYRVSLGDTAISSIYSDEPPSLLPQLLIPMDDMLATIFDFYNLHILVVNGTGRSMMASSLDGSNLRPFDGIMLNSTLVHACSLFNYSKTFVWTDRRRIYIEDYKSQSQNFQHKELAVYTSPVNNLKVLHSSAQPIPMPPNAPEDVEALFTRSSVTIKWLPPAVLQYQGSGAWNNWTYELHISKISKSVDLQDNPREYNSSGLSFTAINLEPDQAYIIKVRARSTSGYGPWSSDFLGRTFKDDGLTVLMGLAGGQIIERNFDTGTEQILVSLPTDVTDIDWHGDIIFLVTARGFMFMYNRLTQEETELETTEGVDCAAYDWLGHKVYWSESVSEMIYRSDIPLIGYESVYRTKARDIAVDAINGRLYWATRLSIETSCLNGDDHQQLFSLPLFSERQIVSLTLDVDSGKVLWFEMGYQSQDLFMTDTIKLDNMNQPPAPRTKVGEFKSILSISSIQYQLQHMFWITQQYSLVIGDSQGNYPSSIGLYSNVTAFVATNPLIHSFRAIDELHVTTAPIDSEDIRIEGAWSDFNLTWPRATGVTHGTVFYKVLVQAGNNHKHLITSKQFYEMSGVSPYTRLVVTIQPYTVWAYTNPTTVSLWSPMSAPSAPLSPEVYLKHHKNVTVSVQSLAADMRWMTPQATNGIITHQLLTYWADEESQTVVTLASTVRHFILTPLALSKTYHFKVAACTQAGCGPESDTKTISTNDSRQVPTLLMASSQGITLTEIDSYLNSTVIFPDTSPKALSFLAQGKPKIFWIDTKDTVYESLESSTKEIVTLNGTGQDLAVDWISRTLYIAVSHSSGESSIMQYKIDSGDYKLFLSRPSRIDNILADPFNSIIIWTEFDSESIGKLNKANLISGEVQILVGRTNSPSRYGRSTKSCSCSFKLSVTSAIAMNYKDKGGATEIIFADKVTGAIFSSDTDGCQCTKIIEPTASSSFGLPPSLLSADPVRVTWYNKTEGKLYSMNRNNRSDTVVEDIKDVVDMQAYGFHLQPLPDSQCLDRGPYNSPIKITDISNTSISLQLTAPTKPPICGHVSSSQYKYTIYYRRVMAMKDGVQPEDCQSDLSLCYKQDFYTSNVELKKLEPYVQYLLQVAVSNYYTEYLSEALSKPLLLATTFGVPGAARNVSAQPLTPDLVIVYWLPPLELNGPPEDLIYVIQFSSLEDEVQKEISEVFLHEATDKPMQADLTQLEPDQFYTIRVLTCTANKTLCSATEPVECKTFQTPSDIHFVNATTHSLEIQWKPPPGNQVSRHHTICAEVKPGRLNWTEVNFLGVTSNSTEYREEATKLQPYTLYAFRIRLNYNARPYNRAYYLWPPQETRFMFRTLVFHPDQASPPTVTRLQSGAYEVRWEEPNSNGAAIMNYFLEYSLKERVWKMAYNGSNASWLIETATMEHGASYVFRVAAVNSEGVGPFSENSTVFHTALAMETNLGNHVTIGVVVGIIASLAAVFIAIVCVLQKRCEKSKTQQFIIRGPDTELATLRELPHTTFQQSNTFYAVSIQCTDEEIANLPHFSRNELVLTMFLGSGAFGEVFEGLAKNIMGDSTGETKCAVKTLRKSATDREKEDFLKEALLMKNFQHKHILSLLGVCLDNDPQFIIMELMEGGDLLSFLRSCRATSTTPAKLLLPDLVKICLHVAKGCQYLEDMHFVHRDLAARNCLVSSKSPADMIVKIGDFGLARDIYKNDYYRKEGEGLLPVRWMSPESLVDGFFTTESDIWAFGVLMWEVITLGQQPYPARTNIEVLHFVRDRGKLERPDKCTDELYSLMSKCWSFHPTNRPCFSSLVDHIENFQEKCKHMTSAEIAHWSHSTKDSNNDVLTALSEEEEEEDEPEEEAEKRGLFLPNSRVMTGGGSVRLTQSGKQRRLNDLLGSLEAPETLVVDLTKAGRKRTHSLKDSKHPLQSSPTGVNSNHFPAANEYDHNGYLEPRGTKGGGRYLDLMNYAPELLHLQDPYGNPLFSGNGSAFLPVHVTHKGYHPSSANYTLLSPEDDPEDSVCHKSDGNLSGSDICGVEDTEFYNESCADQSFGLDSMENASMCSQTQDDEQPHSPTALDKHFEDYYHKSSLSPPARTVVKLPPQRKFSGEDLYFSTAPYRQHRPSSSNSSQEHRYASVECNNNRSSTSNGNFASDQTDACDSSDNGSVRNRHDSGGNFQPCTKPGLGHNLSTNLPSSLEDDSSKLSSGRGTWASNLENVFIDSNLASECPAQLGSDNVNYQGHGHHSSKSRAQVYPEISTAVVGYEINQVSLV